MKIKKCELCGSTFECGGITGCWCSRVHLSRRRRMQLSSMAKDCVCPHCILSNTEED
ncbi:MAG: cysteine-rich CWC family protein [Thermoplasmata archaeon]|uniref:Cysteine-rich CWC family protein n=1 Tax=Candidatus Sysuiplasma superficiale TaxID=2823368 RepID=A0A8J7YIQ2_9ARCH|nr:cysteine-rich CWC family protein [Candidatus Sysuiplasma superficiale]MBX8643984.1 cysteine-rich CWC family protein [Candidatus Sysuiplasma superficiale]